MGSGLVSKSCLTLVTQWTVVCQTPLSMGFSRQKYWNGCHFLLQGIFPTQELNPGFLHCSILQGKPNISIFKLPCSFWTWKNNGA